MFLSGHARFFERLFATIILLTLSSFAYYFTMADLDELRDRFENRRIILVKVVSREIKETLNRKGDLSSRLANLIAEEAIAYAFVQQSEEVVLAKAENTSVAIGVFKDLEKTGLQTSSLQFTPFMDLSGSLSLVEAAMPVFLDSGRRLVLRLGFYKGDEDERARQIWFRNTLLFSTLILGGITYLLLRRRGSLGLQIAWMGGSALLILLIFLSCRFTIHRWFDRHWRQSFVRSNMNLAKVLGVAARRYFQSGEEKDLRDLQSLVDLGESFANVGVIRDDQFLFHTDPAMVGKSITDPAYKQSIDQNKPLCKRADDDMYEVFIPVLDGLHQIGTLKIDLRYTSGFEPLQNLRAHILVIFLAAFALGLFLVYLLSTRVTRDVTTFIRAMEQVTAGDLRQSIYLDRHDEFGQMAQAFNFMLMSLKERDLLNKGMQHYVSKSIVDKTMKALTAQEKSGEKVFAVSLFVSFFGINEAIGQKPAPEVFQAVRDVTMILRRLAVETNAVQIQVQPSGVAIFFTHLQRPEAFMLSIRAAEAINLAFSKRAEMPFSPRLMLHCQETLHGALDDENQTVGYFAETAFDHKAIAQVQDSDEIIFSEEMAYLMQDVTELEEIEVGTAEARLRAFIFRGFKSVDSIVASFPTATPWSRVLSLKVLKNHGDQEIAERLIQWYETADENIRYHILDTLDRLRPPGVCDFVVKIVQGGSDPKVLSKAISVLGKVGSEQHVPLLADKLRTNDRRVKANIIEALESIGGKKVYEFLNLVVDEPDNRVKANILVALGKYGDMKVFDLLNRMIRDSDKNMRASAAFALGKLGMVQGVDPLIAALSDKDLTVRRQVVASLTSLRADLDIDS